MKAPTEPQTRVLAAIQHRARILATEKTSATGQRSPLDGAPQQPSPESRRHHIAVRRALVEVARAGAVPAAWIAHAIREGDQGLPFDPDTALPEPEPVDWDTVLGGLDTEVRQLQHWAALAAAHHAFRIPGTGHYASGIDRNLRTLYARTAGIANLLGIDRELGRDLWGAHRDWTPAAIATISYTPHPELPAHWSRIAQTSTTITSQHAAALANAGITITESPAIPSPDTLLPAVARELAPAPALFSDLGNTIDAAVGAAQPIREMPAAFGDPAAVFSHSGGPEPWSGDPAWAQRQTAPIWQEPGQ
ncbi:hypothetical protein [Nocardia sp. NPDC057227]|uniref:hypothetical protein n=1 Tax=Nocardia sp. NPDC057227 TaxID=3346056 RepID=UPI003630EB8B